MPACGDLCPIRRVNECAAKPGRVIRESFISKLELQVQITNFGMIIGEMYASISPNAVLLIVDLHSAVSDERWVSFLHRSHVPLSRGQVEQMPKRESAALNPTTPK